MELRHLQTFQTIVKEGSFVQAADRLGYVQSTITLHIQQLETELGVKLFARQGKKARLTEAGRALEEQADHLLQRANALQQSMLDIVAGDAAHCRIGAIEPTASLRLPALLVQFCQQRPKAHLTLEVAGTTTISQYIVSSKIDVGICSPPPANLGLIFEPLFVEKMALLLPEHHPLTSLETIRAKDLDEQRLLLTEPGCAYRNVVENRILQYGASPLRGIEIGSMGVVICMVQNGLGLAIVPEALATPAPAGTILRRIHEVDLSLPVGLVYPPHATSPGRALEALLASLRSHLRQ